jgi:tetratricopeptide (TPR) repeat protein
VAVVEEKDNLDIDEEMTKSLQRLVEEETNVAKASVGNNIEGNNTPEIDINLGATRFIDTDLINAKVVSATTQNDTINNNSINNNSINNSNAATGNINNHNTNNNIINANRENNKNSNNINNKDNKQSTYQNTHEPKSDHTKKDDNHTAGLSKRNKIIIASVGGIVAAALIIGIVVAVAVHNNKKNSYHYNYEMGMTLYKENNYMDAIKHLEIAFDSIEGKKNLNMMYVLSEAYKNTGNIDKAVEILEAALAYNKFNERTLSSLLKLCYDNKKGEKLNQIIEEYKDSKVKNVLNEYIVAVPTTSENPGDFDKEVELILLAQDGCTIYYTIDGSTPTNDSIRFTDSIKIEKDTVTVKAIAVNEIGVKSEVGEFQFTIDLKAPEAPVLDIEDTNVELGTKIKIKNLLEGDKAYYTIDGTTPSTYSLPYNDGIELEEGRYVLSVIVINKHNLSSTVTRKNITVKDETEYTYNEALNFLKKRMQELNIIGSNGRFSVGGEMADFVYQTKKEISDIQMYYIRLDKKSISGSKVEGYYGVGVSNGQCYKVTDSEGLLSAVVY